MNSAASSQVASLKGFLLPCWEGQIAVRDSPRASSIETHEKRGGW